MRLVFGCKIAFYLIESIGSNIGINYFLSSTLRRHICVYKLIESEITVVGTMFYIRCQLSSKRYEFAELKYIKVVKTRGASNGKAHDYIILFILFYFTIYIAN